MDRYLLVPQFSRLADWVGPWSIYPPAFDVLVATANRIDLSAHVAQEPPPLKSAMEKQPGRGGQSSAIIKMMGSLMKSQSSMGGTSTVQLRRDIRQAAADPEVSGILIAADSPGGTTAGTDDLATDIRAARKVKPVIGHIDDLAASAAYWALSQCDAIYANCRNAMIGSIGTYVSVYDQSEAFSKDGIKAHLFATGPLKGAGTPGTKLTKEQAAYFQTLTDQSQASFDDAVRRGRGLTDKQLADVRTGAVWLAEEAQGRKLIDGVQSIGKTLDMLSRMGPGKGSPSSAFESQLPMLRQPAFG